MDTEDDLERYFYNGGSDADYDGFYESPVSEENVQSPADSDGPVTPRMACLSSPSGMFSVGDGVSIYYTKLSIISDNRTLIKDWDSDEDDVLPVPKEGAPFPGLRTVL